MRKALALAVLVASGARADGAFPTGMSVLLPAGAPQRILVGTTFGLVLSEDAGATFRYVCERRGGAPYPARGGAEEAASSACARSAMMSSASSIPTASRIRLSWMPIASRSWVVSS